MELFQLLGKIVLEGADEAKNKIDGVTSSASTTSEKISNFGEKVAGVGVKMTKGITVPAVAAGGAIIAFANKSAASFDTVDKMSQKIGISREAYQQLDFICSQSGTSVSTLQGGLKTMTNQMQAAADGTSSATAIFDKLGLSIYDSNGKLKDQETMMWESMEALQGMENQTEKAALANDLFGRSGSELMPLLNGASGSIEDMKNQAKELGLVLSDEAINAGVAYTDKMDQLKRAFAAAALEGGASLLPLLTNLGQIVINNVVPAFGKLCDIVNAVFTWFNNLPSGVQTFILSIAVIAVAIGPVLTVAGKLISHFSSIHNVILRLIPVITGLNPVFLLVVAAITAVIAIIVLCVKHWDEIKAKAIEVANAIKEKWEEFKNNFTEIMTAINNKGSEIWESLKKTITSIVDAIKSTVTEKIEAVKNAVTEKFAAIKSAIEEKVNAAKTVVTNVFGTIKSTIDEKTNAAKTTVSNVFNSIKTTISDKLNSAKTTVTTIFNSIKNSITEKINAAKTAVSTAIERIKGIMNFTWSLPHLKLPHFRVTGKFSLNPPSIPHFSVSWYKNGGILMEPTAFGLNPKTNQILAGGEAGPEAIAPIDKLKGYVSEAVAEQNNIIAAYLKNLVDMLSDYFPQVIESAGHDIVTNDGVIVARYAPMIDAELGKTSSRKGRGR